MYCGYNQLHDPDTMAAAFHEYRERQKRYNQFRPKDALGRYIEKPLNKKEKRFENIVAGIIFLIVLPILFFLPLFVFLAIIG